MPKLQEAKYYQAYEASTLKCLLCPNLCLIKPGEKGRCKVRININGKLFSLNYNLATSGSKDPIEKKPLYHFKPGTYAYSFGTIGCNLFCQFCQNWHISRAEPEDSYGLKTLTPEQATHEAVHSGCESVAYTYNEPFVWYEWVYDTATLVKAKGLKNVLVTNGYIEEEPLNELLPYIDAANVDLKGDKEFYKELCKVSHQEAVLRTCKIMYEKKIHLELTTLLIPGKNDSDKQLNEIINFVLNELGPEVPLHFSRYFPNYKLDIPPTPVKTLLKAFEMAQKAGLHYVYLGNIHDDIGCDTYCKKCGELLVQRRGYHITMVGLTHQNICKTCQTFADFI
ncbi:MAG: AmmeMemoRadiSam system radical SAM enzyme [Candidatus Heimdallarchaeota archaeon]|nr:AmmeMemoRadiSam system radical SAM enzyme [Candidatus Heimdallarchaeota archaeon]